MQKIDVRWRTNHKGLPPRPIKLQIPGWSGHDTNHGDGAVPQPWHCPPFVDGSTYGLELLYPFDAECSVSVQNGELRIEGDFGPEMGASVKDRPTGFAPNHYGFTSSLDLQVPEDMVVRVEPHPRYYTDSTGTCPCPVPGHIHPAFWPQVFFVVFKAPWPGQTHVLRKGEPYAQILIVPRRLAYEVVPITPDEARRRETKSGLISECGDRIARHRWVDASGHRFNDKYKVLQSAFLKRGAEGVEDVIRKAVGSWLPDKLKRG